MRRSSSWGGRGAALVAAIVKVAAIQMSSGQDVAANLAAAADLLAEASRQGAQLMVLPENFAYLGARDCERLAAAEHWGEGPIQTFLRAQAEEKKSWLVGGTIAVWAEDGRARSDGLVSERVASRFENPTPIDLGGELHENEQGDDRAYRHRETGQACEEEGVTEEHQEDELGGAGVAPFL